MVNSNPRLTFDSRWKARQARTKLEHAPRTLTKLNTGIMRNIWVTLDLPLGTHTNE